MSSTESCSDASSFVSENEYISEYEGISEVETRDMETSIIEGPFINTAENSEVLGDDAAFACSDDPVADEEWTADYEDEIRQADMLEEKMQKRLNGTTEISEWYSIKYKILTVYLVFSPLTWNLFPCTLHYSLIQYLLYFYKTILG
mgnify:CR=1 FL=1